MFGVESEILQSADRYSYSHSNVPLGKKYFVIFNVCYVVLLLVLFVGHESANAALVLERCRETSGVCEIPKSAKQKTATKKIRKSVNSAASV